jgi:transketolase
MPDIQSLSINTIRTLCMDAVQQANSGHPGTPMAMAPVAYVLWQEFLRFDPEDPIWPNRDRFILSAGHASTLLYSLLHLARVKAVNRKYETLGELAVPLDDLKNFRQLESKCPGHPGIPVDLRCRDNDGTAWARSSHERGYCAGGQMARRKI